MSARTYLARKARQTGRTIVVGHSDDLGIERNGTHDWWTVCDDHGILACHPTLALARHHSASPLDWCEVCNGQMDEETHQ